MPRPAAFCVCACACANFQLSQSWCGPMLTCSFTVVAGAYCKRTQQTGDMNNIDVLV